MPQLRRRGTHPPLRRQARRYRQAGHWLPSQTATEHIDAISTGGSREALVDNDSVWTYAQLGAAVDNVRGILARAEVTADDAVLILAPVDFRIQELCRQITVVRHDLHSIGPGLRQAPRSGAVTIHDIGNEFGGELSRHEAKALRGRDRCGKRGLHQAAPSPQ